MEASTLATSFSTSSATNSRGSCIDMDSKVVCFPFFFVTRTRCWSCTSSCNKNLSSIHLWRWHWHMSPEPHRTRSPSTFMSTYARHLVNSIHKFLQSAYPSCAHPANSIGWFELGIYGPKVFPPMFVKGVDVFLNTLMLEVFSQSLLLEEIIWCYQKVTLL